MYPYRALDPHILEIRLLEVHPGLPGDVLQASMRHGNAQASPSLAYETISYYWGHADLQEVIVVDGFSTLVPINAAAAIRHIRFRDSTRVVWIDALCINQLDLEERASQVALMRKVYSRSIGNLVFLGPPTMDMDNALIGIDELIREARERTLDFTEFADMLFEADGHHHRMSALPSAAAETIYLKYVYKLFERPWFRRVWVVQEAALAPRNTVLCGKRELSLSRLLIAAAWLSFISPWLSRDVQDLPGICHTPFMLSRLTNIPEFPVHNPKLFFQNDMANLLAFQHGLEASDSRDRVYGLLGLTRYSSSSPLPASLVPDYSKSVIQVLRDATRLAISETLPGKPTGLSIVLRRVAHESNSDLREDSWPTWMPNWERPLQNSKHGRRLHIKFDASRGTNGPGAQILQTASPNLLELPGICLHEITHVGPVLERTTDPELESWFHATLAIFESTNWDANRPRYLARTSILGITLAVGMNAERDITYADIMQREFIDFAFVKLRLRGHDIKSDSERVRDENSARFNRAFVNGSLNRRLFLARDESIGMGPAFTSPGDIVVILYGANTPYVLRPYGTHYQILGQCYMHGAMFGEAVRQHTAEGKPDEAFVIC